MPVMPATLQVEIGIIEVQDQSQKKKKFDPISTNKSWLWWNMPVIPATVGWIKVQAKNTGPYLQNNQSKKYDSSDRGLPSKHKALSSNPRTD
jgi:hypothetical protein